MQDRYAGDANDFIKYLLMRRVADSLRPLRLGICWYLTDPNKVDAENRQNDGDRVDYLLRTSDWRKAADSQLFDSLRSLLVAGNQINATARAVANIGSAGIFPANTIFFPDEVPQDASLREGWHRRSLDTMRDADMVFLDPDNSVSTQYADAARGGKWAAPSEARGFFSESSSVVWISHPRQQRRSTHHLRTMATIGDIEGMFCSLYQGHCGFHFLLCERHRPIADELRRIVRKGISQNWGTWRYCDSDGKAINFDAGAIPQNDEACEEAIELADVDTDAWDFRDAVVVNDHGNFWRKHNTWIDTDSRWEVAFLILDRHRIVVVRFEPFDGADRYGIRPLDTPENLARWRELASGTSNAHRRILPALTRELPE